MVNPILWWSAIGFSILILTSSWFLVKRTNIIKDMSSAKIRPYSFSRVQLLWWTLIVFITYIFIYAHIEEFNLLNYSVLILLGISTSTTAFARLVDANEGAFKTPSDKDENKTGESEPSKTYANPHIDRHRHQDEASGGFFRDILSDTEGISIHRLQNLMFTAIFGILFIYRVVQDGRMPEFGETELILMGISSGTYLSLKTSENK
ncbi:hypothetical protein F9K33_02840 [bacterium]|nr:MAG: hypothetical protein F9K33_02840 [bacterium]